MKSDHPLYQHMLSYKIYKIKTQILEPKFFVNKHKHPPVFSYYNLLYQNLDYSTKIYDKIYKIF